MSADAGHGNKGLAVAGAILAGLGALGIGLIITGMGWQGAGSGLASFISNVGDAIDNHPRMGMLLALFSLAVTGGIAMTTLQLYKA
jgi:hypothetical protein